MIEFIFLKSVLDAILLLSLHINGTWQPQVQDCDYYAFIKHTANERELFRVQAFCTCFNFSIDKDIFLV